MSQLVNIGSNIGYLISGFVSYYTGKQTYSNLLFSLVIISTLYHLNRSYYFADVFVSILVFLFSIWYLYKTPRIEFIKILGLLFMILMFIFLYINKEYGSEQYNNAHPFAHLFGGLATLLVALFGKDNFNQF